MKIKNILLKNFKRFENLEITDIPETAKLVVLTGPNGSGKSSLFEGFNTWSRFQKNNFTSQDDNYYSRGSTPHLNYSQLYWSLHQTIKIEFHDFSPDKDKLDKRLCFYIRSAYRYEADFTSSGINKLEDALDSSNQLQTLIQSEKRISENYNRIVWAAVDEVFSDLEPEKTKQQIKDRLIGQIRESMKALFGDLILSGTGKPGSGGTFRFNKGSVSDFHFKNLSGGENAAFDLLLDFIVKKESFTNTVFCIDEPELHMHTKLQAKLLEQLFSLLPDHCQLWISTHSIGMARKAAELNKAHPGQVAFIDFHNQNFDQIVKLSPQTPTRDFWKNMFDTALDDLALLVVPENVVFCEGKQIGSSGRNPAFDTAIYSKIFNQTHSNTDFISLGGTDEVKTNGKSLGATVLKKLAPGINTWMLFDRDDRSEEQIKELNAKNIRVLKERDLESYLWADEILEKLAMKNGKTELSQTLIEKKNEFLKDPSAKFPPNDIKAIAGRLYNFCKSELKLTQCGNDAEAFARDTLAPLITPETSTYKELDEIIFGLSTTQ